MTDVRPTFLCLPAWALLKGLMPALLVASLLPACTPQPPQEVRVDNAPDRYFVDAALGRNENAGTLESPLATIPAALNKVAESGGEVIVARGVYPRALRIPSAVRLRGGFAPDPGGWLQDPANNPSIIEISEQEDSDDTIEITSVFTVVIEGFTIMGGNPRITTGDFNGGLSAIGVSIHDSMDITLRNNIIDTGNGGNGRRHTTRGTPGVPGNPGDPGEDARLCFPFSDRAPGGDYGRGGPGQNGGPGGAGAATASSENDPEDGISAGPAAPIATARGGEAPGGDGDNGKQGQERCGIIGPVEEGQDFGRIAEGQYSTADGGPGRDGCGGGGGGGGAGTDSARHGLGNYCGASGGGGGEGGSGGEGGEGGRGGGGSFGVLVTASENVRMENNLIRTAEGGDGGEGQLGGIGSSGGQGGPGGEGHNDDPDGGDGGDGGTGDVGQTGGDGGGGPSIGIVEDADSEVVLVDNLFEIGEGGAGPGVSGLRAEHHKTS